MTTRARYVLYITLILASLAAGCASGWKLPWFNQDRSSWTAGGGDHRSSSKGSPSTSLFERFQKSLDAILICSVLAVGVGVALLFILPAEHRLSFGIGGGALAVLALSLLIKVSLWIVPWIAGGIALLGFAWLAMQLIRKWKPQPKYFAPRTSLAAKDNHAR